MAEDTNAAPSGPQRRALSVMAQYIRDLSFENPSNAAAQGKPQIDLRVDVSATPHASNEQTFEVSLKLGARAEGDADTMFICELDYAGLFRMENIAEQDVEPMLLVECPRLLFPFARRIIADVTREGGFPPLMVDPVDFAALYLSERNKQPAGEPTTKA